MSNTAKKTKQKKNNTPRYTSYLDSFKRLKTFEFWRNIVIYFCIFSFLGHFIEWPYVFTGAIFFDSIAINAEVITNPLKPFFVYGFCFTFCAIFLDPIRLELLRRFKHRWQALLIFYLLSVFIAMGMELTQGFLQNQPDEFGNYPLWDVSKFPGNILGQAWIVNDIGFGIVITFAVWHIYPRCETFLHRFSEQKLNRACIIIVVITVLITLLTYAYVPYHLDKFGITPLE